MGGSHKDDAGENVPSEAQQKEIFRALEQEFNKVSTHPKLGHKASISIGPTSGDMRPRPDTHLNCCPNNCGKTSPYGGYPVSFGQAAMTKTEGEDYGLYA